MCVKRLATAFAISALAAAPGLATVVPAGTNGIAFTPFVASTQGTLLASNKISGQSLTFAGNLAVAVYRNTLGTLDFYYQFARTGKGTLNNDAVETITGANFAGYTVDALFSDADIDGTGIFTKSNNPGAPATAQRNPTGGVVGVDFAATNPLSGTQIGATYIFRTNALDFEPGTFGVIDGSTLQGIAYQPVAAAVPEPMTWGLFLVGFGSAGVVLRRSRKDRVVRA